jgi:hypothetical protein
MADAFSIEPENIPTTSREAWLSALPFALIGLGAMVIYIPRRGWKTFKKRCSSCCSAPCWWDSSWR